jgi:integrase
VDIAHVRVREEDDTGRKIKRAKTQSSVRDVPLHPILLQLGLREFVSQRAKTHPGGRLFQEFRLGARERLSDGMTKFWGRFLREYALWKPGRSTHVWRHTFIAALRLNGARDEDIAPIVGHSGSTQTAAYGGTYPLNRKLETLGKLDYGFDVLEAFGGPYDPARHGSVASCIKVE